jgi:hypothetical protein
MVRRTLTEAIRQSGIEMLADRPQKITFGDMREMGVRGVPVL